MWMRSISSSEISSLEPVVELGGAGGLVPRDPGRDLEVAAVSKVLGDPGPAEAVGADLGR